MILALFMLAAPQAAPPADQLLSRMLARYDSLRSYEGRLINRFAKGRDFSETTLFVRATTDGRGRISRSRIEITRKSGSATTRILRVDDGRNLWVYLPDERRYSSAPRQNDSLSRLFRPLVESIRRAVGKPLVKPSAFQDKAVYALTGKGKQGSDAAIYIDRAGYLLRGAKAAGADGSTVAMVVRDERLNPALPASLFQFKPPAGARRVPGMRPDTGLIPST